MIKFILKRVLLIIPVMIGVVALVFIIISFSPGDAVDVIASYDTTEEQKAEMRHEMGLDRPMVVQLGEYLWNVFTKFDLGTGLVNKSSISSDIAQRLPNSLKLALGSIIFAVVTGIPLGIYSALHQNKLGDTVATVASLIGISMPGFWFALVLVLVFSYKLDWLPAYGFGTLAHWILPVITTGFNITAKLCRQTRSSMLEVLRSDYVIMAKSKGLTHKSVVWKHALPNALLPVVTVAGMSFGAGFGGGLIIERVFSIPGMGGYLTDAVNARDHIAVQGAVIVVSVCFSLVMLGCDILMAFIDPRIKARYAGKARRKKNG